MEPTTDADIDAVLSNLSSRIRQTLGNKLVGLYLYGSLVTGDFDRAVSDIDLLAVTATVLESDEFDPLDKMHRDFVAAYPAWNDRIEIAYVSSDALRTFKFQTSEIA